MTQIQRQADFVAGLAFDPTDLFEKVAAIGGAADIILDITQDTTFKVNKGALESHKVSRTQVFGVRVILNDRVGIAYSESADPFALDMMLEHAIDNARVSKLDPYQKLTHAAQWQEPPQQTNAIYSPETQDSKVLLKGLRALEAQVMAHEFIKSCPYNGLTSAASGRRIWSSEGLDVQFLQSKCIAYAYALAEHKGKNAMNGTGEVGRIFADLQLDQLANRVQANALDMLDGNPIASGQYDVVFSVDCLADLLGVFSLAFSGKSALDGLNPWRDSLEQQVADAHLSIVDRPDLPGFGVAFFDSEGIAAQPTTIVDKGILNTLLHNGATAAKSGCVSTGHGSRGPKSILGVAAHQLTVLPGVESKNVMQAGQTLELTELTGLHSGANAISGDFSFGASGYLCQNGQRQTVVRGITVAGNFYEILHRLAIADDQQWNWQKTFLLPSIRFQGLAVSGE